MFNRKLIVGSAALLGLAMSTSAFAGQAQTSGDQLQVQPGKSLTNVTLSVSGPDGYTASKFSKFGSPTVSFSNNGALADGVYTWNLSGATSVMVPSNPNGLDNGRGEDAKPMMNQSYSESGTFRVMNGSVFAPGDEVEGKGGLAPTTGSIDEN